METEGKVPEELLAVGVYSSRKGHCYLSAGHWQVPHAPVDSPTAMPMWTTLSRLSGSLKEQEDNLAVERRYSKVIKEEN